MPISGRLSGSLIRKKFIAFFSEKLATKNKTHQYIKSASLIPSNPTVLLTPAGMLPFVPYFLGIESPPEPPRVVSVQKCARVSGKASDLEFVGRTPRHHTFFEMLGNFSFGDYFKEEAIAFAWEFVTEELELPKDRLWITVYKDDLESRDIWRDNQGVPENRILFCDEKDNFWGPPGPTGPCGPCSEIHFDRGETAEFSGSPDQDQDLLETDRFVEIWNLVFMELFKDADGNFKPLEKKNVDTGMGLERITMVIQEKDNTFETDLLYPIVDEVAKLSGIPYKKSKETDVALKILADHMRCVTFAIADGVTPSNEGRGYIMRMLLRRAVRYGKKYLGFNQPVLFKLVSVIRDMYQETYPELKDKYSQITDAIKTEEQKFLETLDRGSKRLDELLEEVKASGVKEVPGEEVFKLYDTYGFPAELTNDIALEEGFTVDMDAFETAMEEQKNRARAARKGDALVDDQVFSTLFEELGATEFTGYDTLSTEATVKALIVDGECVDEVGGTNQPFQAVLDKTPFYGEGGGQVGDRGSFSREDGHHGLTVVVNDTQKVGELFVHQCLFDNGKILRVGEKVVAQVDPLYRQLSAIHHSATHLLHSALKKVLGEDVNQAGSYVSPEGARFDFSFNRGMTPAEVQRAEYMVNKWVLENTARHTALMNIGEAKKAGAVAMFGEKYGDKVRVVTFGGNSKELCGGTHVNQLGEIGLIRITSESAIASGVRRIEFVAGERAYKEFKQIETELNQMATALKSPVREVGQKVTRLLEDNKAKDKQIKALQSQVALAQVESILKRIPKERPLFIEYLENQTADGAKAILDELTKSLSEYIIMLATSDGDKVQLFCAVSQSYITQGVKAGDLVKAAATVCGGGGGGKPGLAQAGGKDASKIPAALAEVEGMIETVIGAKA